MSEQEEEAEITRVMRALGKTKHEIPIPGAGVYIHLFTPPEMTMEDVARLLAKLPKPDEEESSHE